MNEYVVLPNGCRAHWEVVERILFIYAKLNPGIAYVQGMRANRGASTIPLPPTPTASGEVSRWAPGRSRSLLLPPGETDQGTLD